MDNLCKRVVSLVILIAYFNGHAMSDLKIKQEVRNVCKTLELTVSMFSKCTRVLPTMVNNENIYTLTRH